MDSSANWAEWLSSIANIATAFIAGFTACFGIKIFRHQRTSSDVQLTLGIFATINSYWDRVIEKPDDYNYNMGQIFAQFETAARLFNDSILTEDALPILKDHIVEVYTHVQMTDTGKKFIDECTSSPTTFNELRKFLKQHFPTALLTQQHASNDIDKNIIRT